MKLSFPHVIVFFALLNAISYYVGYMIRVSWDHAINRSSFGTSESPRNFHYPSGRCSHVANQTSPHVEFVRCSEYHLEHCGNTVKYTIDNFSSSGIDGSENVQQMVSWDKGIFDNRNKYYEAMVHPAALLHNNPRRIAIMNDTTGGILREVLKHSMVKEVIYIIPNGKASLLGQEFLEKWNACSSFLVNATSCYNDLRVQIHFYDDLIQWFHNSETDRVDVVFADATIHPNLIDYKHFSSLHRILGTCGILTLHAANLETKVGLPILTQNAFEQANEKMWTIMDQHLFSIGFTNVVDYMESREQFLMAMKCSLTRSNWLWNEAEWTVKIHQRLSHSDNLSLGSLIDGASMMQYQFPTRTVEESWCRKYQFLGTNISSCGTGHGFDPDITDVPPAAFTVQQSRVVNGGRGVFTTQPIAKDSTIALGACVEGILVPSSTFQLLMAGYNRMEGAGISAFWDVTYLGFIDGYGWIENDFGGPPAAGVDSHLWTFANHGCNGTNNVGRKYALNEMNLITEHTDQWNFYEKMYGGSTEYSSQLDMFYHPYQTRHYPMWSCQDEKSNQYIEAGEELLYNYLGYAGISDTNWIEILLDLKKWCNGELGFVARYDISKEDFV